MRRRSRGTWCVVALLVVAFARPARAAPSPAELEAARSAFTEGIALENDERWSDALDRFDRAATIRASPQVVFHRGLCLEHLGRLVEALDAFVRVERDALGDASARRAGQLAGRHVAGLRKRIPVVVLHAPRDEGQMTLRLDGRPLPAAVFDIPLPVDPGDHALVVEMAGHAPYEERITAREADRVEVDVRTGPVLVAPPVATEPAPPARAHAPAEPPPPLRASAAPVAREPSRSWVLAPAVMGGVALAAFATGGVLYGLRASALAELRAGCAGRAVCPDDLRSVQDRGRTETIAGNVAMGVGIAGALAAGVAFVVLRPSTTSAVSVTARGPFLLVEGAL